MTRLMALVASVIVAGTAGVFLVVLPPVLATAALRAAGLTVPGLGLLVLAGWSAFLGLGWRAVRNPRP